ncbi:hypothetical protein [Erwinia endophytica]|uniref:hypothetical protein n=1 Tax=Erwinia endophytica TaxID=1563158 RepID=UPI00186BA296
MDGDFNQFSDVLGRYRINDCAWSMGMSVHFETVDHKSPQPGKRQDRFCADKKMKDVAIPASWELNERQRNFIDSMISQPGKQ